MATRQLQLVHNSNRGDRPSRHPTSNEVRSHAVGNTALLCTSTAQSSTSKRAFVIPASFSAHVHIASDPTFIPLSATSCFLCIQLTVIHSMPLGHHNIQHPRMGSTLTSFHVLVLSTRTSTFLFPTSLTLCRHLLAFPTFLLVVPTFL